MSKIRTVVFSGSFDPVHIGHAMIASYVSQCGIADEVWLMPSRINPLKTGQPPVADKHRVAMCALVARRCGRVDVSDVETRLPEPSFTYMTLAYLREHFPDREFLLLIGSDNWLIFDRWRDSGKIIEEFRIVIYPRPGHDIDPLSLPAGVTLLSDAPQALISSSFVRRWLRERMNLNFFLSNEVLEYINQHNLYG